VTDCKTAPDSLFIKKKYIETTREYFLKYGSRTLIVARFLPIVRTFAPILSGLIRMDIRYFMLYNVIGGAVWVLSLVGGGYYFGEKFPWIVDYVQYIIIFFLGITTFTGYPGLHQRPERHETDERKRDGKGRRISGFVNAYSLFRQRLWCGPHILRQHILRKKPVNAIQRGIAAYCPRWF
jgi:hypothetical protein